MDVEWGWWCNQSVSDYFQVDSIQGKEQYADSDDPNQSRTTDLTISGLRVLESIRIGDIKVLVCSESTVVHDISDNLLLKAYLIWRVQQGTATGVGADNIFELFGESNINLEELRLIIEHDATHPCMYSRFPVSLQHLQSISDESSASCPPSIYLEDALDIVRLHRLGDDLDILSLLNLRLASKALGMVAAQLLKTRLKSLQLFLTPFTDGCDLSGRSVFERGQDENATETVIHSEARRPIEYVKCEDIHLSYCGNNNSCCQFVPDSSAQFSWHCHELSLNNLDLMLANISIREYVGQKLTLYWRQTGPDMQFSPRPMKIADLQFGALPSVGLYSCEIHQSSVEVNVNFSRTRQLDGVTTQFDGRIFINKVNLNLETLRFAILAYERAS